MLKYRIPAALLISGIFLTCLYFDAVTGGSIRFTICVAIGSVIVLQEFYHMVEAKGHRPMRVFGLIMIALLVFAHDRWCWEKWHGYPRTVPDLMSTVIALCVLGACALQGARRNPEGAIMNMGSTLMGLIYVWFLPAFLVKMRHLGFAEGAGWETDGVLLVIFTIFVSKISDVGGFFVGKSLGKHKLSPVVSPKKTWEGLAGGVLASVILALAFRGLLPDGPLAILPPWQVILFGIIMALSSLLGDLLESSMKRDSHVKDSGGIVPGFGGLMDVVDSLMISAPTAYFFFLLVGTRPAVEAL